MDQTMDRLRSQLRAIHTLSRRWIHAGASIDPIVTTLQCVHLLLTHGHVHQADALLAELLLTLKAGPQSTHPYTSTQRAA